jgi:hypothetical protein
MRNMIIVIVVQIWVSQTEIKKKELMYSNVSIVWYKLVSMTMVFHMISDLRAFSVLIENEIVPSCGPTHPGFLPHENFTRFFSPQKHDIETWHRRMDNFREIFLKKKIRENFLHRNLTNRWNFPLRYLEGFSHNHWIKYWCGAKCLYNTNSSRLGRECQILYVQSRIRLSSMRKSNNPKSFKITVARVHKDSSSEDIWLLNYSNDEQVLLFARFQWYLYSLKLGMSW